MDKETEKVVLNLRWTLAACRVNDYEQKNY